MNMRRIFVIAIVAVVCSVCVYVFQERKPISDIALVNVEALATGEHAIACVWSPGCICYGPNGAILVNFSEQYVN